MRYGSVCSGIEAASVAWEGLGWEAAFFAEIDPAPSAVLKHRFPNVPNLGDFTKIGADRGPVDLLVGGTPCQSFSIAGLRAGLDDPRGNLALEFLALVDRLRPRWVLWENVPGVLSSWSDVSESAPSERSFELLGMGGVDAAGLAAGKFVEVEQSNDFDCFLGGLAELGYGCAWRVLDAVYCGVPQRRRRVFVVGHSGGVWQRSAAVLFDSRCMSGDPPPIRKAGEEVAGTLDSRSSGGGGGPGAGTDGACSGYLQPVRRGTWWDGGDVSQTLDAVLAKGQMMPERNRFPAVLVPPGSGSAPVAFDPVNVTSKANRSNPQPGDPHHTLHQGPSLLAFSSKDSVSEGSGGPQGKGWQEGVAFTMEARNKPQMVAHSLRGEGFDASEDGTGRGTPIVPIQQHTGTLCHQKKSAGSATSQDAHSGLLIPSAGPQWAVRRITPRECERLQGFPDDWTLVPYNGKPMKDSPRYKAIGNSMAVPVMRIIGERIAFVDTIPYPEAKP